ncbi:unnamed protein product [Urochloa humidicola]
MCSSASAGPRTPPSPRLRRLLNAAAASAGTSAAGPNPGQDAAPRRSPRPEEPRVERRDDPAASVPRVRERNPPAHGLEPPACESAQAGAPPPPPLGSTRGREELHPGAGSAAQRSAGGGAIAPPAQPCLDDHALRLQSSRIHEFAPGLSGSHFHDPPTHLHGSWCGRGQPWRAAAQGLDVEGRGRLGSSVVSQPWRAATLLGRLPAGSQPRKRNPCGKQFV